MSPTTRHPLISALFSAAMAASFIGGVGCQKLPDRQASADPAAAASASASNAPRPGPAIEFLKPAEGVVAAAVVRAREEAQRRGRTLLVYVGAKWCEPCRRFHEAALKNELAGGIDGLSLLEFDLDADSERLAESGYVSKYIPLFALPADDGIASGKQIEGSVKGPGAADDITPRLRALIGR